jgi:methylated-DNA-[protein]-cysteine S-methyltransferase
MPLTPHQCLQWHHCRIDTPLGSMTLACTPQGLCGAWFDGQQHAPAASLLPPERLLTDDPLLEAACAQLQAYFAGRLQHFELPLDLDAGTAFQQAVWHQLLDIGFGQLGRYGTLARQMGKPRAVRAVGGAIGRNPLSIIVPCHRVLGQAGQLTGYAGGLWRKQALLRLEGHTLLRKVLS